MDVQDGIRRVSASEKPGTGAVWRTANRPQRIAKPLRKANSNRSPRLFCCWSQGDAGGLLRGQGLALRLRFRLFRAGGGGMLVRSVLESTAHGPHTQSEPDRTRIMSRATSAAALEGQQTVARRPITSLVAGPEGVPLAGTLLDYGGDQLDKSVACLPLQCKPSWVHCVVRHYVLQLLDIQCLKGRTQHIWIIAMDCEGIDRSLLATV
jgi:hypothetical protein